MSKTNTPAAVPTVPALTIIVPSTGAKKVRNDQLAVNSPFPKNPLSVYTPRGLVDHLHKGQDLEDNLMEAIKTDKEFQAHVLYLIQRAEYPWSTWMRAMPLIMNSGNRTEMIKALKPRFEAYLKDEEACKKHLGAYAERDWKLIKEALTA